MLVRVREGIVPRSISGFTFQVSRVVGEFFSGSVAAIEPPSFLKLLDRKGTDDVLLVMNSPACTSAFGRFLLITMGQRIAKIAHSVSLRSEWTAASNLTPNIVRWAVPFVF
jgi:hypothetical protein